MKKIILISVLAGSVLFANSMSDIVQKVAIEKATQNIIPKKEKSVEEKILDVVVKKKDETLKDKVIDVAAKKIAKDDIIKKEIIKNVIKSHI